MTIEFQKGVHLRELADNFIAVGLNLKQLVAENPNKEFLNFFIKKSKAGKLYAEVRPEGYGDKE